MAQNDLVSDSDISPRRILCIDGGGIRGTFPASFLASLEADLPQPIHSYFDLIAGTSTGGIIAIGLALGLSASEILALYEDKGPVIFSQHRHPIINAGVRLLLAARRLIQMKHSSTGLQMALSDVLHDRRIGHAKTRLLIPAWNPSARSVYIYKTAHHKRLRTDYKTSAIDVAMATSAAPTFFAQYFGESDVGLIDGGVWANNPIALAVVEAITLLRWPAESLYVLSLGCLDETYTIPARAGLGSLGTKVVSLLMDGQSHGAMGIAKLLTGHEHHREAIYRVNHVVPSGRYTLDDTRFIKELKGLGHTSAREWYPRLQSAFFTHPVDPFVPVYNLAE